MPDNNSWYKSLSPEEQTAYRDRHNRQVRERYASDASVRQKIKEGGFKRYRGKRDAAIRHLGGRCSRPECGWINPDGTRGCTDERCLQIDHVRGDGAKKRKSSRSEYGTSFYRKILTTIPGEEYQLLCANCNWIKRQENNELPQARHVNDTFNFVDRRKSREKDKLGRFTTSAGVS